MQIEKIKAMIVIFLKGLDKLLSERLSKRGCPMRGLVELYHQSIDYLYDQVIIEMFVQQ